MLRSGADAPKPPTYPFIIINVKEHEDKKINRAPILPRRAAHPHLQSKTNNNTPNHINRASTPPQPVRSTTVASVKPYLGPTNKTRKRKKSKIASFFARPSQIPCFIETSQPPHPPTQTQLVHRPTTACGSFPQNPNSATPNPHTHPPNTPKSTKGFGGKNCIGRIGRAIPRQKWGRHRVEGGTKPLT